MSIQKKRSTLILVIVIFAFGIISTWFTWNIAEKKFSKEALDQARIVAESINHRRLQNLSGSEKDLTSIDYLRIKEQLRKIRLTHKACSFLYLLGQKSDGTIFFFVDSQQPNSKYYAAPGLVYKEVSDEYLSVFRKGESRTIGPVTDRWGTLLISLVPIYDDKTEKMIAVLGMDITAEDWNKMILSQCLPPIGLTIFIMILTVLLFMINRNRQTIIMQYNEKNKLASELQQTLQHVQKLQGILPICAKCKKIRDDKGYWNQIETYISEHSEADFSHSLCPECSEELYGGQEWFRKTKSDQLKIE